MEAKNNLRKYEDDLGKRQKILKILLEKYNDGKSKGLYCLVANDMPLNELEQLISKIEKIPNEMDIKEKAKEVKKEILTLEAKLGA